MVLEEEPVEDQMQWLCIKDTIYRALLQIGAVVRQGKAPERVMEAELAARLQEVNLYGGRLIYAMVGFKLGVRDAVS